MKNKKTYDDINNALEQILAIDYVDEKDKINTTTEYAYPFSNEPLYKEFEHLDFKGKSVATVGSSGDQLLTAIFGGAKKVTLIDGCQIAQPIVELKIAAIKNMDYFEFMDYWEELDVLNYNVYSKISHCLSDKSKLFWDTLILDYIDDISELKYKLFHLPVKETLYYACNSFIYDNEDNFKILKKKLEKCGIKFITTEFHNFDKKLKGKYDYIFLSNIYDYVKSDEYYEVVNKLYKNNLNEKGKMQIDFQFGKYREKQYGADLMDMLNHLHNAYVEKISIEDKRVKNQYSRIFQPCKKNISYCGASFFLCKEDETNLEDSEKN